ncbi:dihydroorotate dehydrogenase electron transfer subunit [Breznakia blatticola]|uniref:Dihydroorotate dehydrogenase B (NAD(+)), electron transfer subunit n=1 Tax=Breznakia blatticola TaxID=1754012 RepID=A0A4R7ZCA6_9FIRM|nr:dihydroorotate dehydrogenase electron transfer subunit [Breznakia blatticola]TDW12635.1 dihydroorotate dehydrogenase electron transfer subunit [Breznakia blatticola]
MIVSKDAVLGNVEIAKDTFEMILRPQHMPTILPGQFVNIKLDGFMLRRPISVSSVNHNCYKIIYKVVGDGTKALSKVKKGQILDVLEPLGTPFPIDDLDEVLIIGGGVGVPPLFEVAKQFRDKQTKVTVVLGFNDKESMFYEDDFAFLGCDVYVATMDGSYGTKGTVLDAIAEHNITIDTIYSCGPMRMLEALNQTYTKGYLSFEARMACGIGTCMGCVCKDSKDKQLYYRICKEGPVFPIGKVAFEC